MEDHADPGIVIGAKIGGGLGAPFNDLGGSFVGELELGYLLPLPQPIGHAFELFVSGAYSAPSMHEKVTGSDPRLPGAGTFSYDVDQRLFALGAGVLFRLPLPLSLFAPYGAVSWRGYMIDTHVRGQSDGQSFGENRELGFEHGVAFALGADFFLGPGALLGELQINYAGRDAFVMRDTNLASLALLVGYRFMFGGPAEQGASQASSEEAPAASPEEAQAAPSATPAEAAAPEPAVAAPTAAAPGEAAPAVGSGQIRGTVRSFEGEALQATVTLYPGKQKATTDATGTFSLDVPPGRYSVRLRAFKYKSQSRDVIVTENGVTVLNVELGKK